MINGVSHYLAQTPTLTLFLICHVLSDYQLQSQQVADLKRKTFDLFRLPLDWS